MYGNDDSPYSSDEEEEFCCPLCIEEMDLSDRSFKPCPCGYQICQFCYNNIRENPELNGKCPACRRLYDDESVVYTPISPEEIKRHQIKQANKEKEKKQKERERKDTQDLSSTNSLSSSNLSSTTARKHLSGVRVIQKNLVYVIGFNPNVPTDDLAQQLRGEEYFGQYGKIQKIVINKRTNANGVPGVGVYVTYARKDEAAKCIAAVDGTIIDGKYLRAAYGTTKYCSYYLRNQSCPNPNCMFLHEPGEEADSYSRQDLSTYQNRQQQNSSTAIGSFAASPIVCGQSQGFRTHQISSPSASSVNLFSNSHPHISGSSHQSSHSPRSSSPITGHTKLSSPAVSSASLASDFDNQSPALPATAAWASKPSPQVSHAKISLNTVSSPLGTSVTKPKVPIPVQAQSRTPSPAQAPTPVKNQPIIPGLRGTQSSTTTQASASYEKLTLLQSQMPTLAKSEVSSPKPAASTLTPVSISNTASAIAPVNAVDLISTPAPVPAPVLMPSPRKLLPDPVVELLNNTMKGFHQYFEKDVPTKFRFYDADEHDNASTGGNQKFTSMPPLFSFNGLDDDSHVDSKTENEWVSPSSKFVGLINPYKLQPQISFTVLENFQQIFDAEHREGKLGIPPPTGLLTATTTNTSSSNSQELLARLMKGSSTKDPLPLSTHNEKQVDSQISDDEKLGFDNSAVEKASSNERSDKKDNSSKDNSGDTKKGENSNIVLRNQSKRTYQKFENPIPICMNLPSHINLPYHVSSGTQQKPTGSAISDFDETSYQNDNYSLEAKEIDTSLQTQKHLEMNISPKKMSQLSLKDDTDVEQVKQSPSDSDSLKTKLGPEVEPTPLSSISSPASISKTPSQSVSPEPSISSSQSLPSFGIAVDSDRKVDHFSNASTQSLDGRINNSTLPLSHKFPLNEKVREKSSRNGSLQPLQDAQHITNSGLKVLRIASTPTLLQHSITTKAALPKTLKKQVSMMALDPLKGKKESLTSVETLDDIIAASNNADDNSSAYVDVNSMTKRERRKYEKEKKKQEAQRLKYEEEKLHEEEIRREKERQRLMVEWERDNQGNEINEHNDHVDDFHPTETLDNHVIDKRDEISGRGGMNLFQNHVGSSAGFNSSSQAQVQMAKDTPSSFLDDGSRVTAHTPEPILQAPPGLIGRPKNIQDRQIEKNESQAILERGHREEKALRDKEKQDAEFRAQEKVDADRKRQQEEEEVVCKRREEEVKLKEEEDAELKRNLIAKEAEKKRRRDEKEAELEQEKADRRRKGKEAEQKERENLRKTKELEQAKLQELLKKSKMAELARLEEVRREQEAFKKERREMAEMQKKAEEESRRKEQEEKLKRAEEERKRSKEQKRRADEERKRQAEIKRQLDEEKRKLDEQIAEEYKRKLAEEKKRLEEEKLRLEEEKFLADERELIEFGKRNEQKVKEALLEIVNRKSYLTHVLAPHLNDLRIKRSVIEETIAKLRVSEENTEMLVDEFIQDAKRPLDPYIFTNGVNMDNFQRNFAAFVSSKIDISEETETIDVKQFINSLGLDLNKYSFFDLSAESTAFPLHHSFSQQELMEEANRIRLLEETVSDSEMLKRTSNCGICFVGQDGYKPMEHGPYQTNGLSGFAIKEELEQDVKLVITASVDESKKYLDEVYEEINRLDKKLLKSIKRNRKIAMLD